MSDHIILFFFVFIFQQTCFVALLHTVHQAEPTFVQSCRGWSYIPGMKVYISTVSPSYARFTSSGRSLFTSSCSPMS